MGSKKIRFIGILIVIFGIFFQLNSFEGITGNVILDNFSYEFGSYLGIVLIIGGLIVIWTSARDKIIIPNGLEDILVKSGTMNEVDQMEILPDTIFLSEVADKIKNKTFDMSGYQLVLLSRVVGECQRKNVPRNVLGYLTSPQYGNAKLMRDPVIDDDTKKIITDAWNEYCTRENRESRRGEAREIIWEADSRLLKYGIDRRNKPTLILTEDTHIKGIVPYINKKMGTNIKVYGLNDYTKALRQAA